LDLLDKRLMKSNHVNGPVSDARDRLTRSVPILLVPGSAIGTIPLDPIGDDGFWQWLKIPDYRPQVSPLITAYFGNVGVIEHALWLDPGALANESALEFR
jgi:hypothetical protein